MATTKQNSYQHNTRTSRVIVRHYDHSRGTVGIMKRSDLNRLFLDAAGSLAEAQEVRNAFYEGEPVTIDGSTIQLAE